MEGLAHYDDPTAGWPDPEHTTLQQAVAAFAAAAAAQESHGLHHHHHNPFGDLGTSNNGPDVSRAPGNVQQHDNHDPHSITLAGAAAAAGGMNMPLGSLDLSSHQHLPQFPTSAHHHLGAQNFSLGTPPQLHILPTPANLSQYSHEQDLAAAAAAQAKKLEKKERKRREKAELKRQAEEQARIAASIASQSNHVINDNATAESSAAPSAQQAPTSAQRPNPIESSSVPSTARSLAATFDPSQDDAINRRRANDDDGPITDVNEWLAGSWLKGPALRKVAKEKGQQFLPSGRISY